MIPAFLMILGKRWEVVMVDGGEADDYGQCIYDHCRIEIRRTQCQQQMQDTLLHEATHAIDHTLHNDLTERQVHRVASGTLALLRDNPELIGFLTA